MPIVSMSVNQTLLEKFDRVCSNLGFSTRSEAFRNVIRRFLDEHELETVEGRNIAVVMLIYDKRKQPSGLTAVPHTFPEIRTMLHSHLDDTNCLEVFVAKGNSNRIKDMVRNIRKIKGVKQVEIFTAASDI